MQPISRRLYPVRYWLFVVFAVGVPGFEYFGPGGRAAEHGLFTDQALAQIALSCFCGASLFLITFSSGKAIQARPLAAPLWPYVFLLCLLIVTSILSPKDNLLLSLFRLGEWIVGILLFVSIYTREPVESAPSLLVDLIGKICWISIAIVWVFAVVDPKIAFNAMDEVTGAVQYRLGGIVVHPIRLGVLTAIAFWQVFFFGKRRWRFFGCGFALLTLLLSYSRIAWLGFFASVMLYVFTRKGTMLRVATSAGIALSVPLLFSYSDKMVKFLGRGRGENNLATLSERTEIWGMARAAIQRRPWIGYGFIDGVRNVMSRVHQVTWGTPAHCHNEMLQALASGGVGALVLILFLYYRAWRTTLRRWRRSPVGFLLAVIMIQVTFFAMGGPLLTVQFSQLGVLFVICYICAPELGRNAAFDPSRGKSVIAGRRT